MNYAKAEIATGLTSVDLISNEEEDAYFFRSLEKKGVKLNPKQIEVVRHFKQPLLVDSVAGSGKSSVVAAKISYLLSVCNVLGKNTLLVTYTAEGAKNMLKKAKEFSTVDEKEINEITSGTFHSVFLRLLREEGETRNVLPSSNITMKIIMKKLNMDKNDKPEIILSSISFLKNKGIGLDDFEPENKNQRDFKILWQEYENYKRNNGFLDFTDMLLLLYKKLVNNEKYLNKIRNRFKFIIIDEFQDTNEIQKKIIELIAYPENNVVVVGDCNQTIFSFAGSRVANILDFNKYFPNTKTISLDINYRSTNTILGLANHVIQNNKERTEKISYSVKPSDNHPKFISHLTAEDEAKYIVDRIIEVTTNGEKQLKDHCVLYRNNSNSRAMFDELLMRDVNFIVYGNEEVFYETPIIKPIISYLKLSIDPKKMSALKTVLPTLYTSKDKADFIKKQQFKNPIDNPIEHILDSGLKPFQSIQIKEKIRMIKNLVNQKPIAAIKTIREDYERYLIGDSNDEETLHEAVIKESLDELESACTRFETVQAFVEFVDRVVRANKVQKELQKNSDANCVKLMTIHKSKGLEFPTVYIISCNDGILPSNNALEERKDIKINGDDSLESRIEEERRLLYVAITRAQEELIISYLNMYRGKTVEPSRFIQDYIS